MQLGFVIDHSKCIGCHACTVACKAENDVPLGRFRTWVKYVEKGEFPTVRRSFAVLRCNQCTDAPCVTICPVSALEKRPDGIVDVDPAVCIGCKACMQGCPYDALYLNDATGTAEKCHFCAHRIEIGLAPACAVVCPTEAIIPGDFHDPASRVSRLRAEHRLRGRKPEAGTGPNVLYREVEAAAVEPLATDGSGAFLWADRLPGLRLEAERAAWEAAETQAKRGTGAAGSAAAAGDGHARTRPRTTYSVDQPVYWGGKITGYLFTKSLAAGLFLVLALLLAGGAAPGPWTAGALAAGSLAFLAATTGMLIADLKRPERFFTILTRPNWSSWLTRGSFVLLAFGLAPAAVLAALAGGASPRGAAVVAATGLGVPLAALAAGYTGWLFAQARGRVLWMRRGLAWHFMIQAAVAGAGLALAAAPLIRLGAGGLALTRWALAAALAAHALFVVTEGRMSPRGREAEYRRTHRLLTGGSFTDRPFAAAHWGGGVLLGVALPLALLLIPGSPLAWAAAGAAALAGLWIEESLLVRAGQALPIS